MRQFKFRAMITLDQPAAERPGEDRPSSTERLMVHARRLDEPAVGRYLPALITADGGQPLEPGKSQIATITVTDDEALAYLGPGQAFTLWGHSCGRGTISRRVFTDQGPC
jgi:hypothetical protein